MRKPHEVKLGELVADDEQLRDAVHVAVLPVAARDVLSPGMPVTLDGEGRAVYALRARAVGIVDPYLAVNVQPGQRFWLFMMPRTSLVIRHEWAHPALEPEVEPEDDGKTAFEVVDEMKAKLAARTFLENFGAELGLTYEQTVEAITEYAELGTIHTINRDTPDVVYAKREEMWRAWETVTGKKADDDDVESAPFGCNCV